MQKKRFSNGYTDMLNDIERVRLAWQSVSSALFSKILIYNILWLNIEVTNVRAVARRDRMF